MSGQVTRSAVVVNSLGVHARPASVLVRTAGQFKASIEIGKGDLRVNCKSIMGVLMLAAEQGSTLDFVATGEDAQDAVEALCALVEAGFPGLDQD